MKIAIIGAGMAGLTAARQLQTQGHHVTVYEKSSGVSGRMSTRQTEIGGFDHGAQYFTAYSERFKKEVADWLDAGWITAWDAKLVSIDHSENNHISSTENDLKRYTPLPKMNALAKQLIHGLRIHTNHQVLAINPQEKQWMLSVMSTAPVAAENTSDENIVPQKIQQGPFDAVIFSTPPEQAAPFLSHHSEFSDLISQQHLQPCWSLMLGFQTPLELPFDGAWIKNSRLGWIARDTSKPEHRAGERWVCHATHEWSTEHLEDDAERAKEKLVKAFHEVTGSKIQPVHAVVHRWRYAQAKQPLEGSCLWDANTGIGLCGDWFSAGLEGSGKIEMHF